MSHALAESKMVSDALPFFSKQVGKYRSGQTDFSVNHKQALGEVLSKKFNAVPLAIFAATLQSAAADVNT